MRVSSGHCTRWELSDSTDRDFLEVLAEVGQLEGVDDVLVVRMERLVWRLLWLWNAKRYKETWTRDHVTAHDKEEDKLASQYFRAEGFLGTCMMASKHL